MLCVWKEIIMIKVCLVFFNLSQGNHADDISCFLCISGNFISDWGLLPWLLKTATWLPCVLLHKPHHFNILPEQKFYRCYILEKCVARREGSLHVIVRSKFYGKWNRIKCSWPVYFDMTLLQKRDYSVLKIGTKTSLVSSNLLLVGCFLTSIARLPAQSTITVVVLVLFLRCSLYGSTFTWDISYTGWRF